MSSHSTPDRCPRCGGEAFDEVEAAAGRPGVDSGSTAVGVLLVPVIAARPDRLRSAVHAG